jgi:hypothetical protein
MKEAEETILWSFILLGPQNTLFSPCSRYQAQDASNTHRAEGMTSMEFLPKSQKRELSSNTDFWSTVPSFLYKTNLCSEALDFSPPEFFFFLLRESWSPQ